MKNVLVISSSLRKNSNSETLAKEFMRGAESSGNNVEFITLQDKEIKFCKGCLACQNTQSCVIKDDSNAIVEKVKNADVIVFATPIYYYEMSGQLKTLLDRGNPLFSSDYKFREIYFITSAADTDIHTMDYAIGGIQGWIACFSQCSLKGVIKGLGLTNAGDVNGSEYIAEAYNMGKNV